MKILFGDFNEKEGRANIFKPASGNERAYITILMKNMLPY
jgi:hypothetical protein